ncbi:MAG: DUF401 family protein [Desulfotalea sp.]
MTTFLPFLKLALVFILMLTGIRFKLGVSSSILAGAIFMGFIFNMAPLEILETAGSALQTEDFISLSLIVATILFLPNALQKSGQSKRLMVALSDYLAHPKIRLIFFPALIGLLPMPGGAVFSAPMVKDISEDMNMSAEHRALVNYWFRHVWELVWPMYPGIILTISLADLPISSFISKTWPGVIVMIGIGWLCYLRPSVLTLQKTEVENIKPKAKVAIILYEGLPLIIAIVGSIVFQAILSYFPHIFNMESGVLLALVLACLCVVIQNGLGIKFFLTVISHKSFWSIVTVVVSIFIFKDILQQAGIVKAMAMAGENFALISAAVILPFLVGFVAGINVAFVGATFPLLLGIIQILGLQDQTIAYLVLASFSGFTGVMISPLHICFLLTCEFFGANIATTWKRLIIPNICLLSTGFILFWILK